MERLGSLVINMDSEQALAEIEELKKQIKSNEEWRSEV